MKKSIYLISLVFIASLLLTGCTASEQGTTTGALLGAGTGAVIGHQTGNRAEGALIGGALGAITGHAIGKANENQGTAVPQTIVKCPYCKSNIDVTGFPQGSNVRCPACNNVFTY
ncbi:MAG: glycine zipper 2TM domain-containing protein [Candidatus Aureabacteria bacterium]|nr:glycine zipper 2TM domain-containing protein [Candidatus Auribacterota bacterium]